MKNNIHIIGTIAVIVIIFSFISGIIYASKKEADAKKPYRLERYNKCIEDAKGGDGLIQAHLYSSCQVYR